MTERAREQVEQELETFFTAKGQSLPPELKAKGVNVVLETDRILRRTLGEQILESIDGE